MTCNACAMTDRGAPCSLTYNGALCWASTDLMKEGGKLLTGSRKDMIRSCWRVKSKLSTDGVGEFNGPPVEEFEDCSNVQKRLICYHKLFRFLYGIGRVGVRVPLPSCCVLRIQNQYPDPIHPATIDEAFIEDVFSDGLVDL